MDYKIQIVDFEVMQDWWCVNFMSIENGTYKFHTIENDRLGLIDYTLKHKADTIFVGFNNKAFDNNCWKCVWYGINPYKIVDHLIVKGIPIYDDETPLPDLKFKKNIGITTFDTMAAAAPKGQCPSLKAIEGNLGMKIYINKTIEDKRTGLTQEEKKEMIEYNKFDDIATYTFFNKIKVEFDAYMELIKYYNLPITTLKVPKASMLETIFAKDLKKYTPPPSFVYKAPSFVKDTPLKRKCEQEFTPDTKFRYKFTWHGDEFVVGLGGGHLATKHYFVKLGNGKVMIAFDVKSYYPSMMANKTNPELRYIDNVLPWQLLRGMIDLRLHAKEHKLPIANPLKIPINGASGNFRYKKSKLYDYQAGISMCLTGQLIIYDICNTIMDKVPSAKIFNINTDGFYAVVDEQYIDLCREIVEKFQEPIGIEFEMDVIRKGVIAQKDVNNYVLYNADKNKFKLKGGMVLNFKTDQDWKKYDMAIVDEAVVNKLVFNKPIGQTILDAYNKNEARKFQFIKKSSNKFDGLYTCWYDGEPNNKKYPKKFEEVQKVCRVFGVVDKNAPIVIKKKGATFYLETADCPTHQYIYNGDLSEFDIRKIGLDINWYITKAQERYELFNKCE